MDVQLIHGDALDYIGQLPPNAAILSDPPYGCNNDCDYSRFTGGLSPSRNHHRGIANDDRPFDPAPWLAFPHVCLWGYNHYAQRLPVGTTLVWCKKRDSQLGTFLSDGELAWMNRGRGVYIYRHVWHGFDRQTERGKTLHPTQKPVALFKWCIERMRLPQGTTIVDPYLGSGACGIAATELGYPFIGIELDWGYYDLASARIHAACNVLPNAIG